MSYQIKQFEKESKKAIWPRLNVIARHGDYPDIEVKEVSQLFVAYDGEEPVAFSGLACYHGFWCLRICVVSPEHRGNGLQKKMIKRRIAWVKERGGKWVNVWVNPANTYSLNNILSCGFTKQPEKDKLFGGKIHQKYRVLL